MGLTLLIVVILLLVGTLPVWGHSRNWGYGPGGGLVLLILLVLPLLGYLPRRRRRLRRRAAPDRYRMGRPCEQTAQNTQ